MNYDRQENQKENVERMKRKMKMQTMQYRQKSIAAASLIVKKEVIKMIFEKIKNKPNKRQWPIFSLISGPTTICSRHFIRIGLTDSLDRNLNLNLIWLILYVEISH